MKRYKVYTSINIFDLTFGLAASLALFAYVADDLGWDVFLNLRLSANGISETLAGLEKIWEEFFPEAPSQFSFIDDDFGRMYQNEKRIGSLAGIFSVLALCIAALGVLGLTSFATERRTKEIGIRKVLGASVNSIVYLFSKEFVICVLAANLLAWPVVFFCLTIGSEILPTGQIKEYLSSSFL